METELTAVHYFFGGSGITLGLVIWYASGMNSRLGFCEKQIDAMKTSNANRFGGVEDKLDKIDNELGDIGAKVARIEGKVLNGR